MTASIERLIVVTNYKKCVYKYEYFNYLQMDWVQDEERLLTA